MRYVNPIVATVSPNLYNAAKSANLDPKEINQVEQMSFTINQHRELGKLNPETARKRYDSLDPGIQDQLKFMFKEADYMKAPNSVSDQVQGFLGGALKVAASPLIGLFKLGGVYNRVINEPYNVARQVAQGADPFSAKTWTDAWDGRSLYDNGALSKVTDYFGKYDVEVAKGLLAGKRPGEIIQGYGKVDNNLLESIKKAFNDPDKFKEVLDGVKYAQISPGRDLARMLDNRPNASVYSPPTGATKNASGVIDFMYQLAVDPLTWVTGGLSKGITKGDRIANSILKEIDNGVDSSKAIDNAFQDQGLFNFWERGLGPAVKKFAEAPTKGEKQQAFREIQENYPGYNNRVAIEALADSDAKVYDAASAKKYFGNAKNLSLIMAGRTDGLTYMRNGVAVAKTNRSMFDGVSRYMDKVFNATVADRSALEVDEATKPIAELLKRPEVLAEADTEVIRAATAEIRGWKKIGQLAARSPVGLEVITGEGAALTAPAFTARARQVLPRDMAQTLTEHFLASTADEQMVILRNLDAATMYSMGLGGHPRGEELIAKVLREKYGIKAGFATKEEQVIDPALAEVVSPHILKQSELGTVVNTEGAIHRYQNTFRVGSLPYNEIGSMIWEIKSKKNVVNAVGGAVQGDFSKKMVDAWSFLTLIPRLGIRSAIDEATMYVLTAPSRDILNLATLQGRKMGNISRSFTGSTSSTGPVKRGVQKFFGIGKQGNLLDTIGKKIKINPEEAVSKEARMAALSKYADKNNLQLEQLTSMEKREAVSDHIRDLYAGYLKDSQDLDYLLQAFKHSPDALNSMAQSLIAHSGISGEYGQEVLQYTITPSMLDNAFEEIGVKMGKGTRVLNTKKLSERQVALAQYEKWYKLFVGNKYRVGDAPAYLNPSKVFFDNDGIRTAENLTGAINQAMFGLGFERNQFTKAWEVKNKTTVFDFLTSSADTVTGRSRGLTDGEIAEGQLARVFLDMRETFHGGPELSTYNDNLINLVKSAKAKIVEARIGKSGKEPTWNQASATISLDDFHDATEGFRIRGDINSAIDFDNTDIESVFRRFGNFGFDQMDKQVTGLFRQPAINVAYTSVRKKYAGLEKQMAKQYYAANGGLWEAAGIPKNAQNWSEATALAEKHFTELSLREAADTILKYADNPTIRSNFAYTARTVGRYYRATEDFYRRIYRMKDVSPRVLYRMRLAHLGIDAGGAFHTDQNGDAYIVMPMDNIVFKATDTTLRALTGNLGYSQPNFNEFTLKLSMMNPSFSQDAGAPTLSGPVAGLGVVGVKNFLGTFPEKIPFIGKYLQAPSTKLGESIDTFALGNIGDNIDITRAIIPAGLQKVWAMLPVNEHTRQEVTAAQQAIAYNAAHGRYLDPNATEQEKSDYLKNIRISAHNVLFIRNLLGLVAPVAPQLAESKGVPDYLKNVGITTLRGEFFDILNGISAKNDGTVQDPYELALATFTGKYPGKLIYTVSRESKQTKVLIKNTDKLKDWGIQNESLVAKYGEAAYIFAPQTGKFNAATYNYIKSAGLVDNKSLEKYYDDLMVAEDKQRYYDIARVEKETLAKMSDPKQRANLIADATDARNALKTSNPLLNSALIGSGNNIGSEQVMLGKVEQIISDPGTAVDPATRQTMSLAIKIMRNYIAFCTSPDLQNAVNSIDIKSQRKAQIEQDIKELATGNLYVAEANRAIFKSILNFYSRDSYYAFKVR